MHETPTTEAPTYAADMSPAAVNGATLNLSPSERIQFWRTFQPTANVPHPTILTGRIVDDMACVIAGSKPAAVMSSQDLNDPSVDNLLAEVKHDPHYSSLSQATAISDHGQYFYFLGKKENVKTLADLYRGRGSKALPADKAYHRAVGEALGYPTEAIDIYIARRDQNRRGRLSRVFGRLLTKK